MILQVPSLKLTAKAPENRPSQKEISSSNHPFSDAILVAGEDKTGVNHREINDLISTG